MEKKLFWHWSALMVHIPKASFSGKCMPVELGEKFHASFPDAEVAVNSKVWIDNGIFLEIFIHSLPPTAERGYKMAIYNGHESHIHKWPPQSKVEYQPYTSYVLQPMDKRVFGTIQPMFQHYHLIDLKLLPNFTTVPPGYKIQIIILQFQFCTIGTIWPVTFCIGKKISKPWNLFHFWPLAFNSQNKHLVLHQIQYLCPNTCTVCILCMISYILCDPHY